MVSAGRILILPQGTWDNATMYNMLDLVAYNGISWLCKRQCVGITPSVTATEYWQQFGSSAPIASTTVAGLVMPDGQTITINTTTGAIAVPTATAAALGLVKVDGTSITIDANGVISSAGGNLSNLGDVAITSLTNGQVLIWNQTNQKWQNGTIAGALSALSDVTITSATDEQILVYDSTAQKWKNATAQATLSNSTKPVQTAVVKKALTDVVETVGAGASQAYSEGDIILGNDGTYYKATTDIAQNTTLTVGGNIVATNNRALITNLTQQLTADNGQNFKYGYDSQSGKYGYYVAGSGGADTFIPFSSGSSNYELMTFVSWYYGGSYPVGLSLKKEDNSTFAGANAPLNSSITVVNTNSDYVSGTSPNNNQGIITAKTSCHARVWANGGLVVDSDFTTGQEIVRFSGDTSLTYRCYISPVIIEITA